MDVSVIVATHNPDAVRLERTLRALKAQSLPPTAWETLLVDNASSPPVEQAALATTGPGNLRLLREPQPGLAFARRRGLSAAKAALCVLVDDDNLLAPDYLAQALRLATAHPRVGAFGGRIVPEFEAEPPAWAGEFLPLLALRDLGEAPRISVPPPGTGTRNAPYPIEAAPVGAGMVLRREAAAAWLERTEGARFSDRRLGELSSGGDNDIVMTLVRAGWSVGYFPALVLTHMIPAGRLTAPYLARLNRGIQKSWLQVLAHHRASPWPSIPRWTVPARKWKAWFVHRAWRGPAERVRWQGACGHFEGRVATSSE